MTARPSEVSFVSRNPGKMREARNVLGAFGLRVRWVRRVLPEPQARSLDEVVVAKLAAVRDLKGYVIVEDSGLFIPALHGFPGVYSAHFLETWGFAPMLELLRHRPRRAFFRHRRRPPPREEDLDLRRRGARGDRTAGPRPGRIRLRPGLHPARGGPDLCADALRRERPDLPSRSRPP